MAPKYKGGGEGMISSIISAIVLNSTMQSDVRYTILRRFGTGVQFW